MCPKNTNRMASKVYKYTTGCIVILVLALVIYMNQYTSFNPRVVQIAQSIGSRADVHVNSFRVENGQMIINGVYRNNNSHADISLNLTGLSAFINEIKPFLFTDPKFEPQELPAAKYFKFNRNVPGISCKRLFDGDQTELELAHNLTLSQPMPSYISREAYIQWTSNCVRFTEERGYVLSTLTEVEEEFPIAYSILMFKDVEQSERLLRAIYRPQNHYCIHVDKKTNVDIYNAMKAISDCFQNVFMTSERIDVQWGQMSVLEPELLCMTELWARSKTWKYFINLTGQEFPLRTNYELVRILTAYNGANDVEATIQRANLDRWSYAGTPPHGIIPIKGAVHVVVNRDYVNYVIHNPVARDFLEWNRNVSIPDETFFATLNHNPSLGIKGAYKGLPETDNTDVKPFLARFKNWGPGSKTDWPCHGQRVRQVCVLGTGDLPFLATRREMFANKFYLYYHHFALDCMEELHFNNTRDEYLGKKAFDSRYYANLGFVKNQVT